MQPPLDFVAWIWVDHFNTGRFVLIAHQVASQSTAWFSHGTC